VDTRQLLHRILRYRSLLLRPLHLAKALTRKPLKIYYGCGLINQPGYLNVDVRWTPSVDLLASLEWCSKKFEGSCDEIFLSHVLEHYGSPGRAMRQGPGTVLGALRDINRALRPNGVIRLAVPDFSRLADFYSDGKCPLYPRLLGRLCGEQDYGENAHRCVFDREFLEACLSQTGFYRIEEWDPRKGDFAKDASFDELDGVAMSLNVLARKGA
jgi:predicted SAM-dependent methyltransferase